MDKPTIEGNGEVSIEGHRIRCSPLFARLVVHHLEGKRYALAHKEDEAIEFVADLQFVDQNADPIPEDYVLRPLGAGEDRLQLAQRFLEDRSVTEVQEAFRKKWGDDVAISDTDWGRLTRVANKWGLTRLLNAISSFVEAPGQNARDPFANALYYLLEIVPNPRFAIEDFERCAPDPVPGGRARDAPPQGTHEEPPDEA